MGFFSAYDGTHRIVLNHPDPDKEYWVELHRFLTHGATQKAESHLQRLTMVDGKPFPAPDVFQSQQERVLASIADWNLDEDNGTVLPLNMQSIRRLPEAVFTQLLKAVDTSNAPATSEERRRFPDGDVSGDPDGYGGAASPVGVPGGAPDVAGAGSAP